MIKSILRLSIGVWPLFLSVWVLQCEHPEMGLEDIFPGPGFEKGWSWYGMPVVEREFQNRSGWKQQFGVVEKAILTYFWGDVNDTSFSVMIVHCESPEGAESFSAGTFIPDMRDASGTGAQNGQKIQKRFFGGTYAVVLFSTLDAEKINRAMEKVEERIRTRIQNLGEPP